MTNREKLRELNKVVIDEKLLSPECLADCGAKYIRFVFGSVFEMFYCIARDKGNGKPPFSFFTNEEAFELWKTRFVDLEKAMDKAAYFYKLKDNEIGRGPIAVVMKNGPVSAMVKIHFCDNDKDVALLCKGKPTAFASRITAKEALPYIDFECIDEGELDSYVKSLCKDIDGFKRVSPPCISKIV